jgi:hypothetical protein
MKLSEMLQAKEKEVKIKTVKVKKVRDLLSGGECFETLTGKKVYIRQNEQWFTCMGNKPLNYNFIIQEDKNNV